MTSHEVNGAVARPDVDIADDFGRVTMLSAREAQNVDQIVNALTRDDVVLAHGVSAEQADSLMRRVATHFGLDERLELQAGFAGFRGHRHRIGKYFMSVNKRDDYQVVSPHSEGTSFHNMQLACFYCFENSTDGGETILMNVDEASASWESMREKMTRVRLGSRKMAPREIARARALYGVRIPEDVPRDDDRVLGERSCRIAGLILVDVLARPTKIHSRLLQRETFAYWDTIASVDHDAIEQYVSLLQRWGLLRLPGGEFESSQLDTASRSRVWCSGTRLADLFKCKVIYRLAVGDLLMCNNMTWAHGAANWSPSTGRRAIAASFA